MCKCNYLSLTLLKRFKSWSVAVDNLCVIQLVRFGARYFTSMPWIFCARQGDRALCRLKRDASIQRQRTFISITVRSNTLSIFISTLSIK